MQVCSEKPSIARQEREIYDKSFFDFISRGQSKNENLKSQNFRKSIQNINRESTFYESGNVCGFNQTQLEDSDNNSNNEQLYEEELENQQNFIGILQEARYQKNLEQEEYSQNIKKFNKKYNIYHSKSNSNDFERNRYNLKDKFELFQEMNKSQSSIEIINLRYQYQRNMDIEFEQRPKCMDMAGDLGSCCCFMFCQL